MDKVDSVELAKYIVCKMAERGENINHLKLQKLLYYVQVWHLVYSDEPLIDEDFEAWLHGPVLRSVWNYYRTFSIMLDTLPCKEYKLKLTKEQEGLLVNMLNTLRDYCQKTMEENKSKSFKEYGYFPPKSKFEHPKHVPEDVSWASLHLCGRACLGGHIVENIFYVVFLDKDHEFWLTEKKHT